MTKPNVVQFKKRPKKRIQNIRPRSPTSSSDEEEESSGSHLQSILTKKRKRELLNAVEKKRGVGAAELAKCVEKKEGNETTISNNVPLPNTAIAASGNKDLEERLRGTFSGGAAPDYSDNGVGGGGTMGKKHREAMEEYIRKQMNDGTTTDQPGEEEKAPKKLDDMEVNLHKALEESGLKLKKTENDDQHEGDVGAGGAMLGGTGIAEVILPVDERILSARNTEQAAAAKQRHVAAPTPKQREQQLPRDRLEHLLPINFGAGPAKRKHNARRPPPAETPPANESQPPLLDIPLSATNEPDHLPTDDVVIGGSYSHNFRLHSHQRHVKLKERQKYNTDSNSQQNFDENPERRGFVATRKGGNVSQDASVKNNEQQQEQQRRSNDDRVWHNFIKRQRERAGKRG